MLRSLTLLALNLILGPVLGLFVFFATLLLAASILGANHLRPLLDNAGDIVSSTMIGFAYLFGAIPAILATLATRLSDLVVTRTRARLAAALPIGGLAALLIQIILPAPEMILPLLVAGATVALGTTAVTQRIFSHGPQAA